MLWPKKNSYKEFDSKKDSCGSKIPLPPKSRGGGGSAGKKRGFDAWYYPPVGLLTVRSDPGVGTFDFDRQKPGINSEAITKSVPRGFLKVTLLEKGYCHLNR